MSRIPPSGYYYTNTIARIYLEALEEVMGRNGLNAVLNLASLTHLIDHYPPANLAKEFDFADYAALNAALEEMYGPRGGRGLQMRAGRIAFTKGLQALGALSGVGDLATRLLPLSAKISIGIPAMARVISQISDEAITVDDRGDHLVYTVRPCPACWGRTAQQPICFSHRGVLEQALDWLSNGRRFRVEETDCIATGGHACVYTIYKEPIG